MFFVYNGLDFVHDSNEEGDKGEKKAKSRAEIKAEKERAAKNKALKKRETKRLVDYYFYFTRVIIYLIDITTLRNWSKATPPMQATLSRPPKALETQRSQSP